MGTLPETSLRCGQEPLEFSMLDYLAELPEDSSSRVCEPMPVAVLNRCLCQGVAEKLQRCLKTHEELVQGRPVPKTCPEKACAAHVLDVRRRLCQRNELLQAAAPQWTGRGAWLVGAEAHVRNIRCDGLEACGQHYVRNRPCLPLQARASPMTPQSKSLPFSPMAPPRKSPQACPCTLLPFCIFCTKQSQGSGGLQQPHGAERTKAGTCAWTVC